MEIEYIGERLLAGNIGYLFIALSFGAALLSLVAYVMHTYNPSDKGWHRLGRISFAVHGVAVLGIGTTLFYLIHSHYFEYHYVWAHSSTELPAHYMISCFWEGQEGSFLLWTFWHVILGMVLMFSARKWESPVMAVMALAQIALSSMLLGFEFWGASIGQNPFILLRDKMEAPIFSDPHYLSMIEDGTGLNPLLQNYWMVIHPPVLFLGFAATIVPFAFIIAALWRREYKEWIKPALPWTLFGAGILGLGILMGGAWAYEALTFGGFWAWDPVENAVLVPWMFMVAGLHTMVIYKSTGRALISTVLMIMASFILILYSTFLTRSGILGDTSVHSFTDLGLSGQLLIFLLLFLALSLFLFLLRLKELPKSEKDENIWSREFWMFIGSLILCIAGFQVILTTSIPVFNKIPGLDIAPPIDVIGHYNRFQLPFAVIVALLTGIGQYYKYRKSKQKQVLTKIGVVFGLSILATALLAWVAEMSNPLYLTLLWASAYAVIGNIDIFLAQLRISKISFTGASVAHIGFSLLLIGALISTAKTEIVSQNKHFIDFGEGFETMDEKMSNVYLPKGEPVPMGDYHITYIGDSVSEPNTYHKVEYKKVDYKENKVIERFILKPNSQVNPRMGLISSPDTRHYLGKDVYTFVSSVPKKEEEDTEENEKEYENTEVFRVKKGERFSYQSYDIAVQFLDVKPEEVPPFLADAEASTALQLQVNGSSVDTVRPLFIIKNKELFRPPADLEKEGLRFHFVNIYPEDKSFELAISSKDKSAPFIIMKAMIFPYINILWLGCIVMVVGFMMAAYHRLSSKSGKRA